MQNYKKKIIIKKYLQLKKKVKKNDVKSENEEKHKKDNNKQTNKINDNKEEKNEKKDVPFGEKLEKKKQKINRINKYMEEGSNMLFIKFTNGSILKENKKAYEIETPKISA